MYVGVLYGVPSECVCFPFCGSPLWVVLDVCVGCMHFCISYVDLCVCLGALLAGVVWVSLLLVFATLCCPLWVSLLFVCVGHVVLCCRTNMRLAVRTHPTVGRSEFPPPSLRASGRFPTTTGDPPTETPPESHRGQHRAAQSPRSAEMRMIWSPTFISNSCAGFGATRSVELRACQPAKEARAAPGW